MAYYHGVKTSEVESSLISPVQSENSLPIFVGTAPVNLAEKPAVNEPILCYQYKEFIENFGASEDFESYTLNEAAYCEFALFNQAPAVFVNVLDPEKHFNSIQFTAGGVTNTPVTLNSATIAESLEITSSGTSVVTLTGGVEYQTSVNPTTSDVTVALIVGATLPGDPLIIDYVDSSSTLVNVTVPQASFPYIIPGGATNILLTANVPFTNTLIKNEDFTAAFDSKNNFIITIIDDTKIVNDTVKICYKELDPSQVTANEIIGGYDATTGKNFGLECIEEVFPKYGLVPSIICIPKYSAINSVNAVMKAKTEGVNSVWRAIAYADIPTDIVKTYSDATAYKNNNNLVDKNLAVCWPKVAIDGRQYHLSTQLTALSQQVAAERNDIPFKSPSNENLQCDSLVLSDGTEVRLSLTQANYLNGQGIYTGINWIGSYKGWGDRTSAFPSVTDVKDVFISVRRMFNFVNNELILTFWQKVDDPMNLNLVESVVDSINIWGNGLVQVGAALSFRVELHEDENPMTDLLSGIIRFHIYLSPVIPCEQIEYILEYDVNALSNLFG